APAAAVAAAASAPAAAASAAAKPEPGAPRPFAEVIKGAQRQDGFVPVWRKDEKVWLEIAPGRIGQPMLFSVNVASSVGERGLYASQMGPHWLVEFRRIGNHLQLVALQEGFRADRDRAAAHAVREGFSDSLIGSAPLASAEAPQGRAVLVDASFLLGDLAGYSTALEAAYRLPFGADRTNSFFESARADTELTTLSAQVHYAVPRIPAPPVLPPGATPSPVHLPSTTPDPRSLFVGFVYNFRALPAQPMPARAADPRVGYFTDSYTDLSDDLRANPRVHLIRRWRLEKKDPAAALSEPVKPITYWLDKNIPERYRASIRAGILVWNQAFERIGFKNAIVVHQQGEDAGFDDMDAEHASVRWFVGADVGFAIGPSDSDPRTGEILDADIGMSDVFGRGARRLVHEDLDSLGLSASAADKVGAAFAALWSSTNPPGCSYAAAGANELDFARDMLEARGDLAPDSPEAEAFAQAYVKAVITHEVGHTLGLRHNFKASTVVTPAELRDRGYDQANGISGSVMDYNPFNLPLKGERKGEPVMTGLGPYDYWAIEYGYKPLDAGHEREELRRIAERSRSDPRLVFGDDGDAGGYGGNAGLDPLINRFDLGDDPLAWYERRFALSEELWARVQQRGPQPGDGAERLRRSVLAGLRQVAGLPELAAKYVGGMSIDRDLPGSGKPGFRPVPPAQQRQALRFLAERVFSSESFRFKPEFLADVTPDYIEFARPGPLSVPRLVLQLQGAALDRLLDAGTAQRLLDLPNYLPAAQRARAISLDEVYGTLQDAVWSELKTGRPIDPLRRNLQREYLKRLQAMLTRPSPALPADALSLARLHAVALQQQLRQALARGGLSVENRAHLQDALSALTESLRATVIRSS
ncbi:MAG: zinc-dependent metalloprotease, partial [Burkholderiales bacterium]|nr:zinc-dependent metalloprotease [Burkholderiales bacterium]